MKPPDFILAGECRCGTTSLYEDLIKHPNILPNKDTGNNTLYENGSIYLSQKEPRFFDKKWHLGPEWYFSIFPDVKNTICGDGSSLYLYRALAMERIKRLLPNIKIIIMLRDPVDRLYSHFNHIAKFAPKWVIRYPTFKRFIDGAHENDYYIIDKGIYVKSISNCFRLFDKKQILIIKSEEYFSNTKEEYNKILNFLGQDQFTPELFCHLRSSNCRETMLQNTRDILIDFYKPFNEQLYNLIGICW